MDGSSSSKNQRNARIIAVVDELWSAVELPLTCMIFFGGEMFNGLLYNVQEAERQGIITPDQALGKKALTGLLFFLSILLNMLRMVAAYVLYKGTEKGIPARKAQQYCFFWMGSSTILVLIDGINLGVYITGSVLELALATIALLARCIFIICVRLFIRDLRLEIRQPNVIVLQNGRGVVQHQRPLKLSKVQSSREEGPMSPVSREQLYSFAINEDGNIEEGKSVRNSIQTPVYPPTPPLIAVANHSSVSTQNLLLEDKISSTKL